MITFLQNKVKRLGEKFFFSKTFPQRERDKMINHSQVLDKLVKKFGTKELLGAILGASGKAIYFWYRRNSIPEAFHGKILAIDPTIKPSELIHDYAELKRTSDSLKK